MSSFLYQWNHNFPQIARESGFRLKRPTGGLLDWRLIGSIDVDRLVKENDLDRLDSVQNHLSAAPLSTILGNNTVLDGSVAKYFELAQLSIHFLLFCKQFLDQSVTTLRNSVCELRRKNDKLERLCKKRHEELLTVNSQQSQNHRDNRAVLNSRTIVCSKCCKDAINSVGMEISGLNAAGGGGGYEYIDGVGDHEEYRSTAVDREENRRDINLINAIKLELEVKHLRARLAELEIVGEKGGKGRAFPEPSSQQELVISTDASTEQCDVGVQIDGSSIVHQTEKPSVIVSASPQKEEEPPCALEANNMDGGLGEERLMALVQEQLSKALEKWTGPKRELESVQSATGKIGLSRKPTEIISIAAEISTTHQQQQQQFTEAVKRLLQEEARKIEKHWQTAKQLELPLQDNKRGTQDLPAKVEHVGDQNKMTDEGLLEENSEQSCRQKPLRIQSSETKHARSAPLNAKIDKDELLTPQVVGINTENSYPYAGLLDGCHDQVRPYKRVQLGSFDESEEFSNISSPRPISRMSSLESVTSQENEGNNLINTVPVANKRDSIVPGIESDSSSGTSATFRGARIKVIRDLNDRLRDMGLERRTGIRDNALKAAIEGRLADERDLRKSKWKKFFVIRNRVVSRLNGILSARLTREQQIIQKVLRQEVKQPAPKPKEMRLSGDLKSPEQSLSSHWITRQGSKQQRLGMAADGDGLDLGTMFNRNQDVGAYTDDDDDSGCIQGQKKGDEPLGKAPPKLPRKVLFNLRENNRKLDSLESSKPRTEVRNE